MKHTIHTPTEQYGYVETEFETDYAGAIEEHKTVVGVVTDEGGVGVPNRDFIAILDELWQSERLVGDPGIVEKMSASQREILRAFKLVIKRANSR